MALRRSWANANNPFWSNHVAAWYRSALEAEHYCRKHDLSTTSLMRWARHLLSADDLRKHAERLRNLPRKTSKRQHNTGQSKRRRRYPRYRYGARIDSKPIALQAFWGMHVEAMNWSGMGHAEYAAALGSSPMCFSYAPVLDESDEIAKSDDQRSSSWRRRVLNGKDRDSRQYSIFSAQ